MILSRVAFADAGDLIGARVAWMRHVPASQGLRAYTFSHLRGRVRATRGNRPSPQLEA